MKRRFKVIHFPVTICSGFELGLKEKPLKEKPIDSDSLSVLDSIVCMVWNDIAFVIAIDF